MRRLLEVPAGGRYDLGFVMPWGPVRLELFDAKAALALSPDGRAPAPPPFPYWPDVLSRNAIADPGSPWWTDTLKVDPAFACWRLWQ